VAAFLQRHPDFESENVEAPWFAPCGVGMFRLWPHKLKGEGHFAAVLRRRDGEEADAPTPKAEKLPKQWLDFSKELDIALPAGRPVLFGQSLYWAPPEMPDITGLKVMRPGLELGVIKKDRFEPAHALALWLDSCANVQSYPADSREMAAYIHGDVVPSKKRGWCLVKADDFSIGWGKGDGNVLKNHYPKGIRR
jgi:NOL1/NOP2/fmu family ribosome biogenesis protein